MPLNQSSEAEKETDELVGIAMPKLINSCTSHLKVRGFFIKLGRC